MEKVRVREREEDEADEREDGPIERRRVDRRGLAVSGRRSSSVEAGSRKKTTGPVVSELQRPGPPKMACAEVSAVWLGETGRDQVDDEEDEGGVDDNFFEFVKKCLALSYAGWSIGTLNPCCFLWYPCACGRGPTLYARSHTGILSPPWLVASPST
ncbi:hypothetical protein RJT34_31047 [Clitoria ternatea]|uniref:Uncharacterized protein n=1 Tax=Clitoria ternatea TaxID=43366 RepID=A0AAN9ETY6_CLITE